MGVFVRPMQDELGWSATSISIGFALGSGLGGISSVWVGRILDRHGARGVTVAAGMILVGCMVGLAAMTQVWHFWGFFGLARGTAAAGAQLGTMVALASWFVRKRGRVVGLLGVGQRTGQLLMPLPIVAIMTWLGWREAWLALAGFAFLALVLPSAAYMRRRPEDYGMLPDGQQPTGQAPTGEASEEAGEELWSLAEAKRTVTLWALIVAQAAVVLAVNATNLHINANLQDKGLSQFSAAMAVTIYLTVAALSVFGWGLLMERVHTRYLALTSVLFYLTAMLPGDSGQFVPDGGRVQRRVRIGAGRVDGGEPDDVRELLRAQVVRDDTGLRGPHHGGGEHGRADTGGDSEGRHRQLRPVVHHIRGRIRDRVRCVRPGEAGDEEGVTRRVSTP